MTDYEEVVEKLSQFNNMSFTKKQWEIVLKGCGCPRAPYFWKALKETSLIKRSKMYTLIDMDIHSFAIILDQYQTKNRESVKRSYIKAKMMKKVQERRQSFNGLTFYMVGGALTTEKPERDI